MKQKLHLAIGMLLTIPVLISCTSQDNASRNLPTPDSAETETATTKLALVANGEDFVRQGFVTKDGWRIDFDHVYVTLTEVKAYQTEPPFDPDSSDTMQAKETVVLLQEAKTVDLAEGTENAAPIKVSEIEAPAGTYNALSWKVTKAAAEPAQGQTIVLMGKGSKDAQTVDFVIQVDQPLDYSCGEFVGEERKGILQPGNDGEVEVTFHFDHLFGDGETAADDPLNTDAVGFQPFANLAQDGKLEVDRQTLAQKLPQEDYQKLQNAIAGFGHVGEGHCKMNYEL